MERGFYSTGGNITTGTGNILINGSGSGTGIGAGGGGVIFSGTETISTAGTGTITITGLATLSGGNGVALSSSQTISAVDGLISINGSNLSTATVGNFYGVNVAGTVKSTGTGGHNAFTGSVAAGQGRAAMTMA